MKKMTADSQTERISHGEPSQPIKLNTITDYLYALLAIILYIASIAIVAVFVWNAHQVNDLSVLRENLRNDLVAGDIKHIVQMVLRDIGMMEHTPLDDVRYKVEIKIFFKRHTHCSWSS